MLTRETALARLRSSGTLATGARGLTVISAQQARCPLSRRVAAIISSNTNTKRHGARWLASTHCHAVLP